jgi:hypothetical protein
MKEKVDAKKDKLASTVQKKLEGNPLLLVGSGGSIPYELPSMNELADEIKSKIDPKYKSNQLWTDVETELDSNHNLEAALEKCHLNDDMHEAIIRIVWSCISNKNGCVINRFLTNNTEPGITSIIRKFVQKTGTTNIITTNYDKLIEFSIDKVQGIIKTGFSGDCVKYFESHFDNSSKERVVNLFKVHGSIDWFKHKENSTLLATSFCENTNFLDTYMPMIVTPGNEKYKETHNDPFRAVISAADSALRSATAYLCIGYGFNDDHIQQLIIDENRRNNKPVVIVTKDVTDNIRRLFLEQDNSNFICISSSVTDGALVHYSKSEQAEFVEKYWQPKSFYNLWFE